VGSSAPLALALLAGLLAPLSSPALEVEGRCRVSFSASATLHDFEGGGPCAVLAIEPDGDGRYRARAEVAVAQLETGIAARDRSMREMFDSERYPRITATFTSIDPEALRARRAGALASRLVIHGTERAVTPVVSDWSEVPGKSAHFRAAFDVSLADFGLAAPVALGWLRVQDRVHVTVEVDLTARGGVPHAARR